MSFQSNDEIRFQCRHILTDGRRCKNPTLRSPRTDENPEGHENFCYFHHTTRRPIRNPRARHSRRSTFTLPLLEDRSAIQLAIAQVLQQIASNEIDPRRAGLLLYGLQIATLNLPKSNPKQESEPAATVSEITHDPIHGDLAPPAELAHDEPKGSAQRLLEALPWDEQHNATIPSLQAVAQRERTSPNSHPRKNLRNTPQGRGSQHHHSPIIASPQYRARAPHPQKSRGLPCPSTLWNASSRKSASFRSNP